MAELAALEAMAVQGAQEAMAEQGALEAMADGLRGPWPRSSRPGPYSRNSYTPPKNFPGEVRGYQEPSGAKHTTWQYKTQQERPPGPDRQDRTAHRNQKPSWAGRRALSQRWAGGHWVSGNPVACLGEQQPGNHRRRRISPVIGGHEGSQPVDSRQSRRTPTPSWRGLRAGWRAATSLPRDRQTQEQIKNFSKNEQNKTGWRGAAYG